MNYLGNYPASYFGTYFGTLPGVAPVGEPGSTSTAPQTLVMVQGEVRVASVSFAGKLDQGELLDGTPTASAYPATLTCSSPEVSAAALTINGRLVAGGKAARVVLSGGVAGVEYTVTVTALTTLGFTLVGRFTVQVEA